MLCFPMVDAQKTTQLTLNMLQLFKSFEIVKYNCKREEWMLEYASASINWALYTISNCCRKRKKCLPVSWTSPILNSDTLHPMSRGRGQKGVTKNSILVRHQSIFYQVVPVVHEFGIIIQMHILIEFIGNQVKTKCRLIRILLPCRKKLKETRKNCINSRCYLEGTVIVKIVFTTLRKCQTCPLPIIAKKYTSTKKRFQLYILKFNFQLMK